MTATKAMSRHQLRRRKVAFWLDEHDIYVPAWVDRALCLTVGRGHTTIRYYGFTICAWCDAPVPVDAPDTVMAVEPTR